MIVAWSWLMFGDPFHIRYLEFFSNSLIILERSFLLTFTMAYLAFLYFSTLLWSWDPERLTTFLISPILFLTLKMWFPFCSDCQTLLRYSRCHTFICPWSPVFPNFATTKLFHVHRLKQILFTCELFLRKHLPSGATMINIRWCYNY